MYSCGAPKVQTRIYGFCSKPLPTVASICWLQRSSSGSSTGCQVACLCSEGQTREVALAWSSQGASPHAAADLVACRFCLFHAFFKTKKATPQIPETKQHFSFPLDDRNRGVIVSAFFR